MPRDEGLALYRARPRARARSPSGPGSRSAPGAASPRSTSERQPEPSSACSTHSTTITAVRRTRWAGNTSTPSLVDPIDGRLNTLPTWQRTIADARTRGHGARPRRTVDGRRGAFRPAPRPPVHRRRPRRTTSRGPTTKPGRPRSSSGGLLMIHDVFEDPADGGRPPVRDLPGGARERRRSSTSRAVGSLRVLRASR